MQYFFLQWNILLKKLKMYLLKTNQSHVFTVLELERRWFTFSWISPHLEI